jgi:hypothetical protein
MSGAPTEAPPLVIDRAPNSHYSRGLPEQPKRGTTMARAALDPKKLIFSGTAAHRGRVVAVSPQNSDLEYLNYGRIRLDRQTPRVAFETGPRETALLCMRGGCRVAVGPAAYMLGTYDAIYIPRDAHVEITADDEVDLVECAAEVSGDYPLQIVRYEDVARDSSLKFRAGGAATSRDLNILIGNNVRAGRILAGFTRSAPGNWTSWPPHEHAANARGSLRVFRHAAPGVRHPDGVYAARRARARQHRARRRRGADAERVPSQRGRSRTQHQLHLAHGRAPRS